MPLYAADRDALEGRFIAEAMAIREKSSEERASFSKRCFAEADEAEAVWRERISKAGLPDTRPFLYARAWRGFARDWARK
jgi:hypothetical protein